MAEFSIFKLGRPVHLDKWAKEILNEQFGRRDNMPAYAPFYVEIKTENDRELFPCADLQSAEYCANVMKQYGYKKYEVAIISHKEDNNGTIEIEI